jgi:hypothetical protein
MQLCENTGSMALEEFLGAVQSPDLCAFDVELDEGRSSIDVVVERNDVDVDAILQRLGRRRFGRDLPEDREICFGFAGPTPARVDTRLASPLSRACDSI